MRHGCVPAPYSIYHGVSKLPAGSLLQVSPSNRDSKLSSYWSASNAAVIPPYEVLVYTVSQVGATWVTRTEAVRPPASAVTVNSNASILGVIPVGSFMAGCSYS